VYHPLPLCTEVGLHVRLICTAVGLYIMLYIRHTIVLKERARDTHPKSYITKYTSIRRLKATSGRCSRRCRGGCGTWLSSLAMRTSWLSLVRLSLEFSLALHLFHSFSLSLLQCLSLCACLFFFLSVRLSLSLSMSLSLSPGLSVHLSLALSLCFSRSYPLSPSLCVLFSPARALSRSLTLSLSRSLAFSLSECISAAQESGGTCWSKKRKPPASGPTPRCGQPPSSLLYSRVPEGP